jgi:hypothetical protein
VYNLFLLRSTIYVLFDDFGTTLIQELVRVQQIELQTAGFFLSVVVASVNWSCKATIVRSTEQNLFAFALRPNLSIMFDFDFDFITK